MAPFKRMGIILAHESEVKLKAFHKFLKINLLISIMVIILTFLDSVTQEYEFVLSVVYKL